METTDNSVRWENPHGFRWINQPVIVKGEDFSYEAVCLCSFPKKNGKIRYIVEDNGRLFIQRFEQLTFLNTTDYGTYRGWKLYRADFDYMGHHFEAARAGEKSLYANDLDELKKAIENVGFGGEDPLGR